MQLNKETKLNDYYQMLGIQLQIMCIKNKILDIIIVYESILLLITYT